MVIQGTIFVTNHGFWKQLILSDLNIFNLTIATEFTNILARALQEFVTNVPVSDNSQLGQIYKDLAWSGLFKPCTTSTPFPNLTNADCLRISAVKQAEMTNNEVNGVQPTNNPRCIN